MPADPRAEYDAIVADMLATSPASSSRLFSMPCLKTAMGKAFAGYFQDVMVFKLRNPEHAQALALAGSYLFDPSHKGHPMKEWVVVPFDHVSLWPELTQAAFRYVSGS